MLDHLNNIESSVSHMDSKIGSSTLDSNTVLSLLMATCNAVGQPVYCRQLRLHAVTWGWPLTHFAREAKGGARF